MSSVGRRLVFNGVALAAAVGLLTLDAPSGYYLWHLVKQWILRAGRQAGRAICFTLLKVLVGIPRNSAPGTTHLLPKKEKERERHTKKAGARQTRRVTPSCHSAQLTVLHCRFPAVSPCPCPCPVWTPASHPRKIPNSLIKSRARVRTNKEFENTSQWQRDPKNTIPQWSRTPKCDPKKFSILVFFSSVGNFFGSRFGVRPHWGIVFFGSRCHCEVFSDSLLVRTLARRFY